MTLLAFFIVFISVGLNAVLSEYCYYREGKEGKDNYLECEFFGREQSIEGISLIHLKHNTTIPVLEKGLLAPFKNLKTLYITAANVDRIEPGALHNYKLDVIDLYHNNLKAIENGTFSSQNTLKMLDISYNKFESLETDTFSDLVSLEWLSLISNKINRIDKAAFSSLKNLKALFLRLNKIEVLDADTFQNLVSLELLDLSFNSLTKVPFGLFSSQSNLKNLEIKRNTLHSLADHVFDNASSLTQLDLSYNQIGELQENLFYYTKKLEVLKIASNNLSKFNATSLMNHAPEVHDVYLYHNQWNCDYLRKMLDYFEKRSVFIATSTPVLPTDVRGVGCNK